MDYIYQIFQMILNKRYQKRKGICKGTSNDFWLSILRFGFFF